MHPPTLTTSFPNSYPPSLPACPSACPAFGESERDREREEESLAFHQAGSVKLEPPSKVRYFLHEGNEWCSEVEPADGGSSCLYVCLFHTLYLDQMQTWRAQRTRSSRAPSEH